MRQRLLRILQRPVPGTENLGRKLSKLVQRLLINLFKLLRWVVPIVIGLLALWIIGGNLLAAQQEKKVDEALEQFVQQFPSREANNSALKLEELKTASGFGRSGFIGIKATPTRYLHLPVAKADKEIFESIGKELDSYLDSQLNKLNDDIDAPPESVRQYLAAHATGLEAIYTHVLSSELPRWEFEASTVGDIAAELPSFLGSANFQKILAVDILNKTRQGQTQAALKTLEVSWKLNQAVLESSYYIISPLVAIIVSRWQAVVMRKMQGIPAKWPERIQQFNQHDLRQAFLTGLNGEAFGSVSARKYGAFYFVRYFREYEEFQPSSGLPVWLNVLIDPLLKPYVRLAAVDYFKRVRQVVLKLPEQDFCSFDPGAFSKQPGIAPAWWNLIFDEDLVRQWPKLGKVLLRFELTQKVLQVKEITRKQSNLPKQIPGIEASACRNARWIYQPTTDGTASVSFSKELDWMKSRSSNGSLEYDPGDRLKYSFKPKETNPTSAVIQ